MSIEGGRSRDYRARERLNMREHEDGRRSRGYRSRDTLKMREHEDRSRSRGYRSRDNLKMREHEDRSRSRDRRRRRRDSEEGSSYRDKKKMKMKVLEEEDYNDPLKDIPKVDIYFLMEGQKQRWYSIKPYKKSQNTFSIWRRRPLEPELIPEVPDNIRVCKFAALGTKIFAAGGLDYSDIVKEDEPRDDEDDDDFRYRMFTTFHHPFPSNKVFSIDTLHLDEGWKAVPPMNTKRLRPYMVADGGKMYIFGGLILRHPSNPIDSNRIYAEVYGPSNPDAGWKKLTCISDEKFDLPQTINGHAFMGNEYSDDRKILFHSHFDKNLYFLSTTRQETGVLDNNFGQYHTSSAFLNGALFFLDHYDGLYAHDVSNPSGQDQIVVLHGVGTNTLPQREFGESKPRVILQSLGNGYLALVWAKAPEYDDILQIHCSIIKMWKDGDLHVGEVVNYSNSSVESGQLICCTVVCSKEDDSRAKTEHDKIKKKSANYRERKGKREHGTIRD